MKDVSKDAGFSAWTTPRNSLESYHAASIVVPFLAALFGALENHLPNLETLFQFHKTLSMIIRLKPDVYSDLMDVIAFHSPASRYIAAAVMTTFWPKSVGTVMLSKTFPIISYQEDLLRVTLANTVSNSNRDSQQHAHEFVLWRFPAESETQTAQINFYIPSSCNECGKDIYQVGLYCHFCSCSVHLSDCYDKSECVYASQYTGKDGNTQKIATTRFSHILPQRRDIESTSLKINRHSFRPVHLFTATLCFICHFPLWGCRNQGLKCSSCRHFVHESCLSKSRNLSRCRAVPLSWEHVTIDWDALRKSWLEFYAPLLWSDKVIFDHSFEEVSLVYGMLWTEVEILNAGMMAGSIVVEQKSPRSQAARFGQTSTDNFELHYFVALYKAQLSSLHLHKSSNTLEFINNCGLIPPDLSLLHNIPLLSMIASLIKLPPTSSSDDFYSEAYLQVSQEDVSANPDAPYPYEIASLAHIRDSLGHEVHIFAEEAARFLLSYLHGLGKFIRIDQTSDLFDNWKDPMDIMCSFPDTLAIDASTSVEALFASIQASLEDLDVSVNEFGFLLLVRRCWPSGMMTDYALARLANIVLDWLLTEVRKIQQSEMLSDFPKG